MTLTVLLKWCNFFLTHNHTMMNVYAPKVKRLENIVGKRENAVNQHFLLFPLCFVPHQREIAPL